MATRLKEQANAFKVKEEEARQLLLEKENVTKCTISTNVDVLCF